MTGQSPYYNAQIRNWEWNGSTNIMTKQLCSRFYGPTVINHENVILVSPKPLIRHLPKTQDKKTLNLISNSNTNELF